MLVFPTVTERSPSIMLCIQPQPVSQYPNAPARSHPVPGRRHPWGRCLTWPALVAFTGLLACQGPPPTPQSLDGGSVARFLAEPPSRLLDFDQLYDLQETGQWSFRRSESVEQWTLEPLPDGPPPQGDPAWHGDHKGLEAPDGLRLSRRVDLAASDVHQIEVFLDPDMGPAALRLRWRRSDEETLPERRQIRAAPPPSRQEGEQRYIFHVARRPSWQGQIADLVIDVQPKTKQAPRLWRLALFERQLDREAMAEVAGRGLHLELDHQVREGYLAPPGSSIVRRLDIGAGDRLRFAYGTEPSVRSPITFRIVVEPGAHTTDGESGASPSPKAKVLWQDRVGASGKPWGHWFEAVVDLGPGAGVDQALRLETTVDGPFDIGDGFPVWGHPEVLRPSPDAEPRRPNLLLISLDTVRADRLSLYGHSRATSPHLDAWAASEAVVFEQAVAGAPWTLPSHMTLFSGLDALHHGINHDVGRSLEPSQRGFGLLAEILRSQGYATAATTGGAYLHPQYGFHQGFNSYRYWHDRARDDKELSDGIDRALDFLATPRQRPFFYFLHTYAAHDPYEARQPYFDRLTPQLEAVEGEIALHSPPNRPQDAFRQQIYFELRQKTGKRRLQLADRDLLQAFYDSGLARLDAELQRLFAGIEKLGLGDDTVIVITSDHGENLLDGEEGRVGHLDLYDSNLLVPLVIAWPDGRGAGSRVPQQVRSSDILPTVLASLGLEVPSGLDGVSLLPLVDGASQGTYADADAAADAPPADAWAYCGSANRGLALRRDGHKLIAGNNAWQPALLAANLSQDTTGQPTAETFRQTMLAERFEAYSLTTDARESVDLWNGAEAPDGTASALHQRLLAYWREQARGLRLTVHHPGPGELVGHLEGPMVRPVGTKSIDLICPCLTWDEMGRAQFRVPAGQSFTLQFEKVFAPQLEIRGYWQDGAQRHRIDHTFNTDALPEGGLLRWSDDGRWQTENATEAPRIDGDRPYFRMFWRGPRRQAAESPSLSDPELRRQLEALGYL